MNFHPTAVPGADAPTTTHKRYRLRALSRQATTTEAAVAALLADLAIGTQPERALTVTPLPAWASCMAEAR